MINLATASTTQALATDPRAAVLWLGPAAAILLAGLGRRRLPPGVSEGLFVGSLSGLLLTQHSALFDTSQRGLALGAGLVALAVLWLVVGVWIERDTRASRDPDDLARRGRRRQFSSHATALAAALALPALLAGGLHPDAWTVAAVIVLLAGVAAAHLALLGVGAALWALVATPFTAAYIFGAAGPRPLLAQHIHGLLPFALGAVALALVLWAVLRDWRHRARIWHADPARLVDPPPPHRTSSRLAVAFSVLTTATALLRPDAVLTPIGLALAAYACLGVGHRRRSNALGAAGLAMGSAAVLTVPIAWLPSSPANAMLGAALAGMHMLWLARFWQQQLDDGRPWTTTGRLISAARRLGQMAVGAEVLFVGLWFFGPDAASAGGWQAYVVFIALTLHATLLIGDAVRTGGVPSALAGSAALVVAGIAAVQIAQPARVAAPLAAVLGVAALLLALRTTAQRAPVAHAWAYNAYVGGLLPVGIWFAAAAGATWTASPTLTTVGIGGVLLATVWRWVLAPRLTPPGTEPATGTNEVDA